jgi:hypothetical protein
MNKINISINYAGLPVQVTKLADGDNVKLKQVCDGVGIDWKNQRRKILESDWLRRRFGIKIVETGGLKPPKNPGNIPKNDLSGGDVTPKKGENTPQNDPLWEASLPKNGEIFIRLSKVAAFLTTINPDLVRSHGNISSADWLEAKITEWDDAIHDYEEIGVAVNLNHVKHQELLLKQQRHIAQLIAIKNKTEPPHDRKLLEQMIGSGAKESGLVYQPDLIDTGST